MPWILLLVPVLLMTINKEKTKENQFIKFILLVLLACIFSMSQTASVKDWYDAIWYPLLALLTGTSIVKIISAWPPNASRTVFAGLLLISIWPFSIIIQKNISEPETQHVKPFLDKLRNTEYKTQQLYVYNKEFNPALFYYIQQDQQNGFHSSLWNEDLSKMPENVDVLTINAKQEHELLDYFNTKKLDELDECKLFRLEGVKREK